MLNRYLPILAAMVSAVAMAQEVAPPETIKTLWVQPGALLIQQEGEPPALETRKANGRGLVQKSLSVPKSDDELAEITDFKDGFFWAVRESNPQSTPDQPRIHIATLLFRSSDGFNWEHIGTLNQSWGKGVTILPLEENKFFMHLSVLRPMEGNQPPKGFSPFAVLRLNSEKKRLEISHFVEPGFEKPFYDQTKLQAKQVASIKSYCNYPKLMVPNVLARPQHIGKHIIFPWLNAGYVSVFSANSGKFKNATAVYSGIDGKALRSGGFGWALLGTQPMEDGRLLIAARQEGAVLSSVQTRIPEGLSEHQMKDAYQRSQRQLREDLQRFPDVLWWTFDPETSHYERASAPRNFPSRLPTEQAMEQFRFRIKADGNLLVVSDSKRAK